MDNNNGLTGARTKDEFLSKAHEARQARELSRKQERAAIIIQAHLRSYHVRCWMKRELLDELKQLVSRPTNEIPTSQLVSTLKKVIVIFKKSQVHHDAIVMVLRALSPGTSAIKSDTKVDDQSLMNLIICDCIREKQVRLDWSSVLEYLINFSLDILTVLIDNNSTDVQNLALHLSSVNQWTPNDFEEIDDEIKQTFVELSSKTCSKRSEIFKKLSETVSKTIKGPKTELRTRILNEYVKFASCLLQPALCDTKQKCVNDNLTTSKQSQADLLINFLSVPILVHYLELNMTESSLNKLFNDIDLFSLTLRLLNKEDHALQNLTSTPALCLLANLIHLSALNESKLTVELIPFTILVTKLLEICHRNSKQKVASRITDASGQKRTVDESYNQILGWLTRETAPALDQETSNILKNQLNNLWKPKMLKILFFDLMKANEDYAQDMHNKSSIRFRPQSIGKAPNLTSNAMNVSENHQQSSSMVAFRRVFERAAYTMGKTINSSYIKSSGTHLGRTNSDKNSRIMNEDTKRIAMVCFMLNSALKTLRMIRQDILTALCLHDYILNNLWIFISSLGPQNGMKAFLDYLTLHTKSCTPEFHILMFFCECASHIISILDDSELYEQQKPFTVDDLISISQFLNTFVFRLITNQLVSFDPQNGIDPILQATHKLLTDLYKRDCRRTFAPDDHWLMSKDLKMSVFLRDLEQGKPVAKALLTLMPHIIAHKERVLIFRKLVARDKAQHCSGYSTFITIHRSRIVEDGYQQLARLPPKALKGLIRVKFINDHGLDEAGIDQDGVFKEFLEDTIKRVFDPALNLFSSTSEQRLYPSPTSRLHEDHLSLFNFVGKMLGKAVYEGIVVDVPFASFFLSRVLGQPQSPLYSPIDELPSLDPELYKSLTYIKHYEGDVKQLDLTFSIDQDFMGKIETHELEPGGKYIPVTKESRVRYIHSVANFRMKTQIEEQTEAFVRGFKSIVNLEWLSMFSASEFQRLISGDTAPIDLQDLRKHTKYFGGFHNNHRVVCWLWDILERDFTPEEHRLFLKFVTSCSKPPLLGFANLEPLFSIRCVEVSDDQDLGDTVGSVLRGFLAIRRSDPVDRLPTSSTCFNLLKLPNYQRRSTLREKLRYAIRCSTGFELS